MGALNLPLPMGARYSQVPFFNKKSPDICIMLRYYKTTIFPSPVIPVGPPCPTIALGLKSNALWTNLYWLLLQLINWLIRYPKCSGLVEGVKGQGILIDCEGADLISLMHLA